MSRYVLRVGIKDAAGEICDLFPFQKAFEDGVRSAKFGLLGGGYGPGKTSTLLKIAVDELTDTLDPAKFPRPLAPPYRLLLIHETIELAYTALVGKLFSILPRQAVNEATGDRLDCVLAENKTRREIIYGVPKTGRTAVIRWTGFSDAAKIADFQGSGEDFDKIVWSQCDLVKNEDAFFACIPRLRRIPPDPRLHPQWLGDANPCKSWVYLRFPKGKIGRNEDPRDYFFLNARTSDNPLLAAEFLKSMEALPPEKRRIMTEGDWDAIEGLVYEEFDPLVNVIDPDDIRWERTWRIDRAIDRGYHPDPFACIWYVQDHDGNTIVFRELERYKLTARQRVEAIRAEDEKIINTLTAKFNLSSDVLREMLGRTYGPVDLNTTEEGFGRRLGDLMLSDPTDPAWRGISVDIVSIKGIGQLGEDQSGIANINALLSRDPNHKHPITGQSPAPRLYVSKRCPRLIAQMTSATWEQPDGDRMDKTKLRNHFADEDGATHHWDLQSCLRLTAQQVRLRKVPEEKRLVNPAWERLEAAMHGKPQRGSYVRR